MAEKESKLAEARETSAAPAGGLLPIPGADVVGRGIRLRPHQPYSLKARLFPQQDFRRRFCPQTRQTYSLPTGCEVNDSPPMPVGRALNRVVIEESWERFDQQFALDASLAASLNTFSIEADAGEVSQVRSEESAYYALRSSFVPYWSVYLSDVTALAEGELDIEGVPAPFEHRHRRQYERFFERYGTHYVKRVWVGGQAKLAFTIAKSSNLSKQDIQRGIKASGLGQASANLEESKQKLQSHSECTVWGKGGSKEKLAALSSLDEESYNQWLATVKDNPQTIELEVAGIWTLVDDEATRQALLDAYKAETTFIPILAGLRVANEIYFLRGNTYLRYDMEKAETKKPKPIERAWPMFAQAGLKWIDAAFSAPRRRLLHGRASGFSDSDDTMYVFSRDRYLRLDIATKKLLDKRPRHIAGDWPGVVFERIDAALSVSFEAVYFFLGEKYIRFDVKKWRADEGYPKSIVERWVGVTFDRLDAALYWEESGKAFFFRGDQHIRYDMVTYRADPGYPKAIVGSYVEDWKFFN